MAARRLILILILLLVLSSVIAALAPVRTDRNQSTDQTSTNEPSQPSGDLIVETLRATAGKPETVKIHVGDQLVLRVTSKAADQVEIPELGELGNVDRDSPARFDLLPFEAGTYPVRLVDSRRLVGRIVVSDKRQPESLDQGGGESTIDSPGESTAASTAGARLAS